MRLAPAVLSTSVANLTHGSHRAFGEGKFQIMNDKTFDQLLTERGESVLDSSIAPSIRVPAEIIFEPMGAGIRVTARSDKHVPYWGFVASEGSLKSFHTLVGIYPLLRDSITCELNRRGLVNDIPRINQIEDALSDLKVMVVMLTKIVESNSLSRKKKEDLAFCIDQATKLLQLQVAGGEKEDQNEIRIN